MHDPEKSDSGIVVMKPMNKAGRLAAELVEPRPGTKGNADQQSTHRTQSRARVTQAPLDRVRKGHAPSGTRRVLNEALSIYFADATLASAFVTRWCARAKVETAGGVFQVREDKPEPRVEAGLHWTP